MKPTENVLNVIRKMNSKSIARFAIYLLEQELFYQKDRINMSLFHRHYCANKINEIENLLRLFRYYLVDNIATEKYLFYLKELIHIYDYYKLREILHLYNININEEFYLYNFNFSYNDFFKLDKNTEEKQIELLNLFIEQYS
jgi:hypothetical protein